jgi:4-hydroxy-tetrahydrodipicolinate reductase
LDGLPPRNLTIIDDTAAALAGCGAAIEFSTPVATIRHAALVADRGVAYIVGTTGLSAVDEGALARAAAHVPVVYAANFSAGMNVLADLVRRTAATLGPDFDIEISEMHHRHKVDSPSGSALMLGRAATAGRNVALDEVAIRGRDGVTGVRPVGGIGFVSLRGGDVAGDHTVIFAGEGERLELTHRAGGREIFARGAVRAAIWASSQPPGLYSMRDVLGLDR